MTKREKELLAKIEQLETRIRALESRPGGETHHHYHYEQPRPAPALPSVLPGPATPFLPYTTWCVSGSHDTNLLTLEHGALTSGPEH